MILISLDEAGVFEAGVSRKKFDSKTDFIGGIVFDDRGIESEEETERNRIIAYYDAVISRIGMVNKDINFSFPKSLHYSQKKKNNDDVSYVKKEVDKSLSEFIKYGTYKGEELGKSKRQGQYYVCAIAKGKSGKTSFNNDSSNFLNDEKASNIYIHMMSVLSSRLIFNNPVIDVKDVKLDIASRASAPIVSKELQEYINQGFDALGKKDDDKFIRSMNKDVLRTVLKEQSRMTNKDINVCKLEVEPIKYDVGASWSDNAFRYLSDSVCSYISYKIGKDDVLQVLKKSIELAGEQNQLVFAYDDIDDVYERALNAYRRNDYYDMLWNIYDIEISNGNVARLYKEYWAKYLIDTLDEVPFEYIENTIDKIHSSIMSNKLEQQRELFIFETIEGFIDEKRQGEAYYKYNDAGVVFYCHIGDEKNAAKYYEKCEKYHHSVGFESYVRTRNRYATALFSSFKYKEALDVAQETIRILNECMEFYSKIFNTDGDTLVRVELAKTYSVCGQCCAFMRDNKAEELFEKALEIMKGDIANYNITLSYFLHYLIDNELFDIYKEYAREYYDGQDNCVEQLKNIISCRQKERPNKNYKFALFIFVKSLYASGKNEEVKECWPLLNDFILNLKKSEIMGHPWELIFKYCILIKIKLNDMNNIKEYESMLNKSTCNASGVMLELVGLMSSIYVKDALGNKGKAKQITKELWDKLKKEFELYIEYDSSMDVENKKQLLEKTFVYMYC